MPTSDPLPNYDPEVSEPAAFDTANAAMQHYARKVRLFMVDEKEVNQLLQEREFSWPSVYRAVEDALADWNSTPPFTGASLEGFPVGVRPLLYMRAAVWLLRSVTNLQARNQLSYSDQGWSVQEFDKAPVYMQIAQSLDAVYEEKKLKYKTVQNADAGWGGFDAGGHVWGWGDGYGC